MLIIWPTDRASGDLFLSGWKSPEHDFIWSLGPINIINIPIGPASEYRGKNLKFSIELNVPITDTNPNGSRLTFMLGDSVMLEQTVKERTRIIFNAPATATAPRIEILHITNHNPASIDGFLLGFQLYSIEIVELPMISVGQIFQFGKGSPHTSILGPGWKDPEEGFCWSAGVESLMTLIIDSDLCRYNERDCTRVAEIILSVSFNDRIDPALHHWHILDVVYDKLLLQRQIYPERAGLVPIRAYVPISSDVISELRLIDHCATTPALLGNDPNDHTVLGFQLFTLELTRVITLPYQGITSLMSLLAPGSRLRLGEFRSW